MCCKPRSRAAPAPAAAGLSLGSHGPSPEVVRQPRNERVPVSSPRSIGDGRPGGASGAASAPTARAIQLHMTKVPQSLTQNEQAHTGTTRTLVARVAAGTDIPHPAALAPEPHGTPRGSGRA